MYLQVRIQIPEKLSREERELYEWLRALPGRTRRHFGQQVGKVFPTCTAANG